MIKKSMPHEAPRGSSARRNGPICRVPSVGRSWLVGVGFRRPTRPSTCNRYLLLPNVKLHIHIASATFASVIRVQPSLIGCSSIITEREREWGIQQRRTRRPCRDLLSETPCGTSTSRPPTAGCGSTTTLATPSPSSSLTLVRR